MISILTTNVFPGQDHIIMAAKCLSTQTCQDFEWVFLDGHYNKNKDLISSLCDEYKIKRYIHAPLCKAEHIGRRFHWEIYNNALLLASNDLFLRFGVYRWIHSSVIENAVNSYYQNKIFIDLSHKTLDLKSEYLYSDPNYIVEDLHLEPFATNQRNLMVCSSGMFCYTKSKMLMMNGNDEAAILIVHCEDADLNSRWSNCGHTKNITYNNSMIRFEHHKSTNDIIPLLEGKNTYCCGANNCLIHYPFSFNLDNNPPVQNPKFEYKGFTWIKCDCCGTVAPVNADSYLSHTRNNKITYASVGVDGRVGRDINILNKDINKINNINEKFNILLESHTNLKYLNNTEL
jgi:hypothetical protein